MGGFGVCQERAVQLPATPDRGLLCGDRRDAGLGTARVESVIY